MRDLFSWAVLEFSEWSLFQYLCLGFGMAVIYLLLKVAAYMAVSKEVRAEEKKISRFNKDNVIDMWGNVKVVK